MRRPAMVTVFGIVNLIFGALGVFGLMSSLLVLVLKVGAGAGTPLNVIMAGPVYRHTMAAGLVLSVPQLTMLVAGGVGLLKMRRWGRNLSIAYGWFALASAAVMSVAMYQAFYLPMFTALAGAGATERMAMMSGLVSGIAGTVFGMLYPVILLLAMHRPSLRVVFADGYRPEEPVAPPMPLPKAESAAATLTTTPIAAPPRSRTALPENAERLGAYLLVARLAHGAMGEVWEAECTETRADLRPGDRVALKMVPEFLLHDTMLAERLKREAEAISRLRHPGIVAFHELGEADGRVFMVMELLHGETLAERLEKEKQLPVAVVERIGGAVADALAYIHGKGIYHRDLKPQNIFLTEAGAVKLIDLGVAKVLDEASLTMTGSHFGTPAYMSPESFRDSKAVTGAADVWSLGVILYEMATGQLPFPGSSAAAIIAKISDTNVTPQSPARLRTDLPANVARVIAGCLERQPSARGRAAQLIRQLGGKAYIAPADTRGLRLAIRVVLGIAATVAVLAVVGVVLVVVLYGRQISDAFVKLRARNRERITYAPLAPAVALTGDRVQLRLVVAPKYAREMSGAQLRGAATGQVIHAGSRGIVIDETAGGVTLYFDGNNDGDPRNDGSLAWSSVRETTLVSMRRRDAATHYRSRPMQLFPGMQYTLSMYVLSDTPGIYTASIRPEFTWRARVRSGGETDVEVIVIDQDCNGMPSAGDNWVTLDATRVVAATRNLPTPRQLSRNSMLIGGREYWLENPGADGTVWLTQTAPAGATPAGNRLDLNTATVEQLTALPGVGAAAAQRIVDYREQNGDFADVADLNNVPGIGAMTVSRLEPYLIVGAGGE